MAPITATSMNEHQSFACPSALVVKSRTVGGGQLPLYFDGHGGYSVDSDIKTLTQYRPPIERRIRVIIPA
jgi:hypothetical protein